MEKRDISLKIANNIRDIMNQKGLSNADLARNSKIASGTISKILSGTISISVPMALSLAQGLETSIDEIVSGLDNTFFTKTIYKNEFSDAKLLIGIMSINNKRMCCIKTTTNEIIGRSELYKGLDLAESTSSLMDLIQESIESAFKNNEKNISFLLKNSTVNLVMQSYEFEETRKKFYNFVKRKFKEVRIIPDWQITYFSAFDVKQGISLIIDKGVSLSYMTNCQLKKIGGWKFPVYDLGGENWIGLEAIRHTIDAIEGYIKPTQFAQNIIAKFDGKIEKITETCFKGSRDPDIYCTFCELALRAYVEGDTTAKMIIAQGYKLIKRSIDLADSIIGEELQITLNGSLANIYKSYLPSRRLLINTNNLENVELLATIDDNFLQNHGVIL